MHGSQMMYAIFLMISQAWQCSPALAALFAPARPLTGRYEVCSAAYAITDAVADATRDGYRFGTIDAVEPLDALGAGGAYDRFAVARLYRGRRARVTHGWRQEPDGFRSITLISPYPDASLTHLMNGTMRIEWRTIIRGSP